MRAKITNIYSPDIYNLSRYHPDDPEKFSFLLQVFVCPIDGEGEESFSIEVCTPKWLIDNFSKNDVVVGRHLLIVFEYNYERIVNKIRSHVDRCSGDNWRELAEKIGRIGKWEFEDYSE